MKTSQRTSLPIPCVAWAKRLAALHPDDLTPDEQAALKQHMASCSDCAAVYAAYQQIDAGILSLPTVQPSAQQVAQLEALITDSTSNDLHDPRRQPAASIGERTALPARAPARLARIERRVSYLAAVLVVVVLAASAFALFSLRHTTSVVSAPQGIVYTVSYSGTVYALDPGNGKIIWSTQLQMKPDEQFLVSGGKIFLASSDTHFLYALQISDGHLLWKRSYKKLTTVDGMTLSLSRYLASDGQALYIGSATGIYAWSASDGRQLWHHAPPAACISNPNACLIDMETVSNGLVYVYFDGLYALNATNGKTSWYDLKAPNLDFTSYPLVVTHNHLYVPNYNGSLTVHVLQADNGKLLDPPGFPQITAYDILTDGNTVYLRGSSGSNSDVYAIQGSDDSVLWHTHYTQVVSLDAARSGSLYYSYMGISPSASAQKPGRLTPVTIKNIRNRVNAVAIHLCAVSVKDGSSQWCLQLPSGLLPSAAVSQGIVYCPGFSQGLDAIRTSDGKILWHILANTPLDDADTVLV